MSDIKLFRLNSGKVTELKGEMSGLEKQLQTLIENNLETLLGVRFLSSEYSTGKTHGGRIDSLGLDENACPVIIEYKRSMSENVINQGLFYLDWLMDHQAEFKLLAIEKLGSDVEDNIDWTAPRLICIASDFTKYDAHAVQQMNRNIELIRYRNFSNDLLLFELVNSATVNPPPNTPKKPKPDQKNINAIFVSLDNYLMSLGDDVQRKELKLYVVYKRLRNFVCVVPQKGKLVLHVSLEPENVELVENFTRDMRGVGHWGTGDLEILLRTPKDLETAMPLLKRSYDGE